jgi:3-oxoadipate enol-lactonase
MPSDLSDSNAQPLNLHYREDGNPNGPPVLLVHAFPTSHALWEHQIEALGQKYRLIRSDLRGFGQSPVPEPPYSMDAFAGDLMHLLDRLEIERINYVGISMGGMIGQVLTLAHPERVQSLAICMSTSAIPEDTPPEGDPAYYICKRLFGGAADRAEAEGMEPIVAMCLDRWFTPAFQASPQAQRVGDIIRGNTAKGYRGGVSAMSDFNVTARLGEVSQPTLVMPGAQDQGTPVSCSETIAAALPDAHLEIVENARHIAIVEQPEACNRHMLAHLNAYAT